MKSSMVSLISHKQFVNIHDKSTFHERKVRKHYYRIHYMVGFPFPYTFTSFEFQIEKLE